MNYRSVADLNDAIFTNMRKLPGSIDLIVGVPRSGLLPATLVSLAANVPLTDVEGFCEGRVLAVGKTRRAAAAREVSRYKHALIIDDAVDSGGTIVEMRRRIEQSGFRGETTYCAVYGRTLAHPAVDIVLDAVPYPQVFQWNVMHHGILNTACVDIDGVLCCDPIYNQDDDEHNYLEFLANARPYCVPTKRIGYLVTSRPEKYRTQTERWLEKNNIEYGQLFMRDPERDGMHAAYKAEKYRQLREAILFIESEHWQALEIAKLAGKPVLCMESQQVIMPDTYSALATLESAKTLPMRLTRRAKDSALARRFKDGVRRIVGPRRYVWLRDIWHGSLRSLAICAFGLI